MMEDAEEASCSWCRAFSSACACARSRLRSRSIWRSADASAASTCALRQHQPEAPALLAQLRWIAFMARSLAGGLAIVSALALVTFGNSHTGQKRVVFNLLMHGCGDV